MTISAQGPSSSHRADVAPASRSGIGRTRPSKRRRIAATSPQATTTATATATTTTTTTTTTTATSAATPVPPSDSNHQATETNVDVEDADSILKNTTTASEENATAACTATAGTPLSEAGAAASSFTTLRAVAANFEPLPDPEQGTLHPDDEAMRHREMTVMLTKKPHLGKTQLGLTLKVEADAVLIETVGDQGVAADYNRAYPTRLLKAGQRITAVNKRAGTGKELIQRMVKFETIALFISWQATEEDLKLESSLKLITGKDGKLYTPTNKVSQSLWDLPLIDSLAWHKMLVRHSKLLRLVVVLGAPLQVFRTASDRWYLVWNRAMTTLLPELKQREEVWKHTMTMPKAVNDEMKRLNLLLGDKVYKRVSIEEAARGSPDEDKFRAEWITEMMQLETDGSLPEQVLDPEENLFEHVATSLRPLHGLGNALEGDSSAIPIQDAQSAGVVKTAWVDGDGEVRALAEELSGAAAAAAAGGQPPGPPPQVAVRLAQRRSRRRFGHEMIGLKDPCKYLSGRGCYQCEVAGRPCDSPWLADEGPAHLCGHCQRLGLSRGWCIAPVVALKCRRELTCHICRREDLSAAPAGRACRLCPIILCDRQECKVAARFQEHVKGFVCCHCLTVPAACDCEVGRSFLAYLLLELPLCAKPPQDLHNTSSSGLMEPLLGTASRLPSLGPEHRWLDMLSSKRHWHMAEHTELVSNLRLLRWYASGRIKPELLAGHLLKWLMSQVWGPLPVVKYLTLLSLREPRARAYLDADLAVLGTMLPQKFAMNQEQIEAKTDSPTAEPVTATATAEPLRDYREPMSDQPSEPAQASATAVVQVTQEGGGGGGADRSEAKEEDAADAASVIVATEEKNGEEEDEEEEEEEEEAAPPTTTTSTIVPVQVPVPVPKPPESAEVLEVLSSSSNAGDEDEDEDEDDEPLESWWAEVEQAATTELPLRNE